MNHVVSAFFCYLLQKKRIAENNNKIESENNAKTNLYKRVFLRDRKRRAARGVVSPLSGGGEYPMDTFLLNSNV